MTSFKDSKIDCKDALDWPKHLRTPNELIRALRLKTKLRIIRSPLCTKLVLQFIGGWSYILANVLNKARIYNHDVFDQELRRLENASMGHEVSEESCDTSQIQSRKGPLITLSNHISCIDDPVLWGALLPFNYYFTKTDNVRWSAAAVDICFSKPWHSTFFSLGKTFPIMRGIGLEQPAMDYSLALLEHNEWLHLFPEGRVMRDQNQQTISNRDRGYIFKWGIAKLILDFFKKRGSRDPEIAATKSEIRILPFYHLGLDKILPIGRPYIPKFGHKMTIFLRPSTIHMDAILLDNILNDRIVDPKIAKSKSSDELMRIKLTNYLEDEMMKLVDTATRLHDENN